MVGQRNSTADPAHEVRDQSLMNQDQQHGYNCLILRYLNHHQLKAHYTVASKPLAPSFTISGSGDPDIPTYPPTCCGKIPERDLAVVAGVAGV